MKRIRIVQLIEILLVIVYICLIICDLTLGILGDLGEFILSILLVILSINLIHKGFILRSQSTIWFAITLMLFAISIIVCQLLGVEPIDYYFVFALIPIVSSVINVAIFANLFYIKVIIFNISIAIPIIIMYFLDIGVWFAMGLGTVCVIAGIVICRVFSFRKEKM